MLQRQAFRYLAAGLFALLAAGCSELSPPQPTLEVQVLPQAEVVADTAATYTVGSLVVRGVNFPQNATATVSLVSPPQGVALVSPTSVAVSPTPATQDLRLSLNPNLIFGAGETSRTLSLTLRVAAEGADPVTRSFNLNLRRSGGGATDFAYTVSVAVDKPTVAPGETFTLTAAVSRVRGSGTVNVVPVLPEGFTATPTSQQVALGDSAPAAQAVFQVAVGAGVASGSYTVGAVAQASGVQAASDQRPLTVSAPSLALALSQADVSLRPGGTATVTAFVSGSGLGGDAVLEVEGLPAGVSATLPEAFPLDAPILSKTITFTAGASAVEGTYPVRVNVRPAGKPTPKATASLNLVVAPQPSLAASVTLNRLGVFNGETVTGTVTVRSQGGLSGTVVVQVSACSIPATAISYAAAPYGYLASGGTFSLNFSITVPADTPAGLCQVQATATLNEHSASAQAAFDILPRPEMRVTLTPSQVIAGTVSIPADLSIRLVGSWNGLVTAQVFDENLNPLTSSTATTYEIRGVHTSTVTPNASGYAYFPLSGDAQGLFVLSRTGGWSEGEYTFYLRLDGPNQVFLPFTVKVLP